MDCRIEMDQLTDFFFGIIDQTSRAQVEGHLLTCHTCLEKFIVLKRDIDLGRSSDMRPSLLVRQKLLNEAGKVLQSKSMAAISWAIRPRRLALGSFVAVAAITLITIFIKNPFKSVSTLTRAPSEFSETLTSVIDETIDYGGTNPGHINTL